MHKTRNKTNTHSFLMPLPSNSGGQVSTVERQHGGRALYAQRRGARAPLQGGRQPRAQRRLPRHHRTRHVTSYVYHLDVLRFGTHLREIL